jgi:PAS domain S-box-containing protein
MSAHLSVSVTLAPLRHLAETRLKNGNPPAALSGWNTGLDALTLLHKLASSPTTAGDALKLLHELQVHEVELTLQQEQLEQGRAETAEALDRYVERFDFAPLGYFAVDVDGKIIEANLAGAELFLHERSELPGVPVETLVAAESRGALRALLRRLRAGDPDARCLVHLDPGAGEPRVLLASAKASSRERCVYVCLTDISACATADRHSSQ